MQAWASHIVSAQKLVEDPRSVLQGDPPFGKNQIALDGRCSYFRFWQQGKHPCDEQSRTFLHDCHCGYEEISLYIEGAKSGARFCANPHHSGFNTLVFCIPGIHLYSGIIQNTGVNFLLAPQVFWLRNSFRWKKKKQIGWNIRWTILSAKKYKHINLTRYVDWCNCVDFGELFFNLVGGPKWGPLGWTVGWHFL